MTTVPSPSIPISFDLLDHEPLNLVLQGADLGHQIGGLVGGDGSGNDAPGDTASAAERHLGGNINVGNVLVFAKERDVEDDGKGTMKR